MRISIRFRKPTNRISDAEASGRAGEAHIWASLELKHVLAFEVLEEIDGFLKRHSVFEPYTPSDFEREQRALDSLVFEGVRRSSLPIQDRPIATDRVA
jgi:hypothetical protein